MNGLRKGSMFEFLTVAATCKFCFGIHITMRERVALGFPFSRAISKNCEICSSIISTVGRNPCTEMSGKNHMPALNMLLF